MTDTPPFSETSGDDPFTAILNQYAAALQALGANAAAEEIERLQERLIAQHPQYASRLRDWFEQDKQSQRVVPAVPGYEVVRELGRGGMGVVYLARQQSLGRLVALKMILAGGHAGPVELARFQTEAEAAARLSHPNIVQIHEVGRHAAPTGALYPYMVLEYLEGGNLAARLAAAPLTANEAAELVETLARAVHSAHEAGIVHRDLKPANVLLASRGRESPAEEEAGDSRPRLAVAKITDFGLAKRLDIVSGQTQSGAVLGTPSYMAPEQARGNSDSVGPAVDVYALGAMLYEMLTRRPPFTGASALEILDQVRSHDPVPPRRLQPSCPRDLETICLKCLEKNPADRYDSAQALGEDLHRFLVGDPIRARPVGWIGWTLKKIRRYKGRVAVAGVFLLALALVTGFLVKEENERAQEKEKVRLDTSAQIAGAMEEANQHKGRAQASSDPEQYALGLRAAKRAAELLDAAEAGDDLRQRVASLVAELEAAQQTAQAAKDAKHRDAKLLEGFQQARLRKTYPRGEGFDYEGARQLYLAAFVADGVDVERAATEKIVAGFAERSSSLRIEAAAALTELGTINAARAASNPSELILAPFGRPPSWQRFFAAADAIDDHPSRKRLRKTLSEPFWKVKTELAQLGRSVNIKEHSLTSLTFLADALGGFEMYDEAVALLLRLHEHYEDDFWVNHFLSIYSGHTNPPRWDEAARFSTSTLACRKDSPLPHYNLGVALLALGRRAEAIGKFRRATEIDATFSGAWLNLGSAMALTGKEDDAIRAWETAYKLDRNNYQVMASAGNRFFIAGDFERAEPIYRLCTQIAPNDALAHYNLGTTCMYLEHYEEALPHFRRALDLTPSLIPARVNLAISLASLGRYEEALREYRTALDQARKSKAPIAARIEAMDIPQCEREGKVAAMWPDLRADKQKLETKDDIRAAALVAYRRGEFTAAAGYFLDDVQGADRKWLEEHSYLAACAAAEAASVEKTEAKAVLRRRQALDCLRHELRLWEKSVSSGKAAERAWGARMLRRAQVDSYLAGVRDADRLKQLSEAERADWEQLWAAVRKLTPP
jgi:serine/threonine-protein kinase